LRAKKASAAHFGFEKRFGVRGKGFEVKESLTTNPEPLIPLHILLVEDNPFNQQVALVLLKKQGLSADIAENGKIAVEILETSLYDLVLMDVDGRCGSRRNHTEILL